MGYCIHYAVREGMLRAAVSGKVGALQAERIGHDISEAAGRETVSRVLIDMRGLSDRLGSLGALTLARCEPARVSGYRVAVVDGPENDAYYALHEMAARARGYVLRCFSSMAEAIHWLHTAPSRD